jgi:hypothetical protein
MSQAKFKGANLYDSTEWQARIKNITKQRYKK